MITSYEQFQIDQINKSFALGVQQANQIAQQQNQQVLAAKENQALANVLTQINRQAAINSFSEVVKYTRMSLNLQNQIADRTINQLKQNLGTQIRAADLNQRVYTKIIEQRRGAITAEGSGGGLVANKGTSKDLVLSIVSETKKDANTQYKSDLERIMQTQESIKASEISKAFNNFNTETQIKFSTETFKGQIL